MHFPYVNLLEINHTLEADGGWASLLRWDYAHLVISVHFLTLFFQFQKLCLKAPWRPRKAHLQWAQRQGRVLGLCIWRPNLLM